MLRDEGVGAVESWTAKKNIDIFSKKFIFLPVNKSLHWSLCVIVNPGMIEKGMKYHDQGIAGRARLANQEAPCILFLDSLKMHAKKKIADMCREWLNSEWKRLKKKPVQEDGSDEHFDAETMPVLAPGSKSDHVFALLCVLVPPPISLLLTSFPPKFSSFAKEWL